MKLKITLIIISALVLLFAFGCQTTNSDQQTPNVVATPKILIGTHISTQDTAIKESHFVNVVMGSTIEKLAISCSTIDAIIYYTLDGSTPNTSSAKWDGNQIDLLSSCTIKAIAVKTGMTTSAVATYNYVKS